MLISGHIFVLTIYIYIGVVNSGRHDSPHIRKLSLDHDSGGRNRGSPVQAIASRGEDQGARPRATDEQLVGGGQGVCVLVA